MSEIHYIAQQIVDISLGTARGQRTLIENIETGKVEVEVSWTRRKYKIKIKYRKTNLFEEFPICMIKNSYFMELFTGSVSLTMTGSHSKATDFILSNSNVLSFLEISKSKVGTNGKFLVFQMAVRRNNQELLSDIFSALEEIGEEFNEFMTKNK